MSRRKLLREPRFQYRSSNKATASTHLTFAVSNILQTKLVVVRSMHGFRQGRTQGRAGQRFSRHILLRCWHRICVVLHGGMVQASKVALAAWGWVNLWPCPQPCSESCLRAMCCVEHLFSTAAPAASRRIKRHASFGNCLPAECPGPGAEQ